MKTKPIHSLIVDTHNWGKTAAFWQGFGYAIEFETDHHSGLLRHPDGAPAIFVREVSPNDPLAITPTFLVADAGAFEPPTAGTVVEPFRDRHWGVREMVLGDPDGRPVSIQSPLPGQRPPGQP